jgi:hypothetical protein
MKKVILRKQNVPMEQEVIEEAVAWYLINIPKQSPSAEKEIERLLQIAYTSTDVDESLLTLLKLHHQFYHSLQPVQSSLPKSYSNLIKNRVKKHLKPIRQSGGGLGFETILKSVISPAGAIIGGGILLFSALIALFISVRKSKFSGASTDLSGRFDYLYAPQTPPSSLSPEELNKINDAWWLERYCKDCKKHGNKYGVCDKCIKMRNKLEATFPTPPKTQYSVAPSYAQTPPIPRVGVYQSSVEPAGRPATPYAQADKRQLEPFQKQ